MKSTRLHFLPVLISLCGLLPVAAGDFDLAAWKSGPGAAKPLKAWSKLNSGLRQWNEIETLEFQGEIRLELSLGKGSLFRVRPGKPKDRLQCDGLSLRDANGRTLAVRSSGKRGGKEVIGEMLELPSGEWTLEGTLRSKKPCQVVVEVMDTPALPKSLQPYLKSITLPLDRIGSFGARFDPEGEKARNYAAMLAHRLAVQQDDDGSWAVGGYASRAFPTSACGLALLSTGDPAYDAAIRRAAYYVAGHGTFDKWRYSTPPYGSAENGHATQTLHFVWGCLSTANTNPEAHRENMRAYLWKFTTLREFDGFMNKNNYRTEYHNGDGVIGEPYWRTAGYLMVMNAHKRNLAITGEPKYRGESHRGPIVHHRDTAVWNQVLRNWALVEAVLGEQAPASFGAAATRLRELQPGTNLGAELRRVLTAEAPRVAADLLELPESPAGIARGQLAQLVLGHAFEASFTPSAVPLSATDDLGAEADKGSLSKKEQKKRQKEAAKALAKKIEKGEVDSVPHALRVRPVSLFQRDPEAPANQLSIGGALFPVSKLSLEVADPDKKLFKRPLRYRRGADGKVDGDTEGQGDDAVLFALREFELKLRDELLVRVSYESGGLKIAYTAPLAIPAPESRGYVPFLTRVPVDGSVLDDYSRSYSMRILLDTGRVLGCEQHGNPIDYLLEGGRYRYLISPNSGGWGHDLRAADALDPDFRVAPIRRVSSGSAKVLVDRDRESGLEVVAESEFVFELAKPATISSVYMSFGPKESRLAHRIDAMVDGEWVLMREGAGEGLRPVIPATTSRIRLRFPVGAKGLLSELRFITPAPARSATPRFSW